jgi:LysR family glycine cleavage system transcriptional activator
LPIKVTVHPTNTNEDWAGLPHDAAIRREDFTPPGYEARTLVREELTAFVRPDAAAKARSPGDVVHCESITRPGDLDRWLAASGLTRAGHPRRQYAHFYIAYEAALAGEGLVVAPTFIAAADVQAGRLIAPWPSVRVPGAQCFLVYPKANRNLIAPFADWLREEIDLNAFSPIEGA